MTDLHIICIFSLLFVVWTIGASLNNMGVTNGYRNIVQGSEHQFGDASESTIDEDSNRILICCSWSDKLSNGTLTYSILTDVEEGGESAIEDAINEWDSKLVGLEFFEVQDPSYSDIQITFGEINYRTESENYEFKNKIDEDLKLIPAAGWTQFTFDKQGFIDSTKIIISKDVFDQGFNDYIIEQIAKHELGHALGLGHANFEDSLMANIVIEDETDTISECEITGVNEANQWKFINHQDNPEYPRKNFVMC
jgi:hypothetical protein